MPGFFINLQIDFKDSSGKSVPAELQARKILTAMDTVWAIQQVLRNDFNGKIGITYSANRQQSLEIRQAYQQNRGVVGIGGSNQAEVMARLEDGLRGSYSHLLGVAHILPISTCQYAGGVGAVQDGWLKEELEDIEAFLLRGGIVFGWQNQAVNGDKGYPIGGGISRQLTSSQQQYIQMNLSRLSKAYQPPQGFVQTFKNEFAIVWQPSSEITATSSGSMSSPSYGSIPPSQQRQPSFSGQPAVQVVQNPERGCCIIL